MKTLKQRIDNLEQITHGLMKESIDRKIEKKTDEEENEKLLYVELAPILGTLIIFTVYKILF